MIFEKNSLIYKHVPRGDPEGKGIDEAQMSSNLDPQASSDQKTTQILIQTSNDISPQQGTTEADPSMPDAIITGSILVLIGKRLTKTQI